MNKNGFTLAELLVSVGILAVVATLSAPIIDSIKPDGTKAQVLKAYKMLVDVNNEILSDTSLYMPGQVDNPDASGSAPHRKQGACQGLSCDGQPHAMSTVSSTFVAPVPGVILDRNKTAYGANKYLVLFPDKMRDSISDNSLPTISNNAVSFNTSDGCAWHIAREGTTKYIYSAKIDVAGNMSAATAANASVAPSKNQKQFVFYVDNLGVVHPVDKLSQAYIMNPTKLNNRRKDLKQAANNTVLALQSVQNLYSYNSYSSVEGNSEGESATLTPGDSVAVED